MAKTDNSDTVPGVMSPTKQGQLSGNPRSSAIASQQATSAKAANLSAAVGGSKKRKKGGDVAVPQYTNMQYTPQNGPGQDPNSQITGNTATSTQTAENSKFDDEATKGGSKKKRSYKKKKKTRKGKKGKKSMTGKGKKSRRKTIRRSSRSKSGGRYKNPDWSWGCSN